MLGIGTAGPLGPVHLAGDRPVGIPEGGSGSGDAGRDRGGRGRRARAADEREALVVLVTVDGLGPMTLGRLIASAGSAVAVLDLALAPRGADAILELAHDVAWDGRAIGPPVAGRVVEAARARDRILARIAAAGVDTVILSDPDYPPRLRATAIPPHVLFVRGDRASLASDRAMAVVGTRRPTTAGRLTAARIARALVRAGASVVSGLAVGVDGAAHEATLTAGGLTVAVIGSGHARLYPARHGRLADAIVDAGGAVVSELAPDVGATQGTFPRRNRLISGLAEATIVVEAPARSGALTTAAWALEQGRGCFLVPGGLDAPMSAGCLAFLREAGAEARIVAGIPELLDDLGLPGTAAPRADATSGRVTRAARAERWRSSGASVLGALAVLDPTPRLIAEALIAGAATVDELVAASGLPVATVLGALTRLESHGLVVGAYGRYVPAGALAG